MIAWIKRKLSNPNNPNKSESVDNLPAIQAGSQKAIDTESRSFLLPNYGIRPPYDLSDYLSLYLEDDLAHSIVDADVDLVCSPLICNSASDTLSAYVDDFHKRIDITSCLEQIIQDVDVYGFHVSEIVGNGKNLLDSTEIIGLFRIDPRTIIIQKNAKGRLEFFRQRPSISHGQHPGFVSTGGYPLLEQKLDPQSIVYIKSINPLTSYGLSILQPVKTRLQQRGELISASVLAMQNHASPVIHLHYKSDPGRPESGDEINAQKTAMKDATEKVDTTKSRWLFSAGAGTYTSDEIGTSSLPNSQGLIDYLTASIIICSGLSPPGMGYILGKGVTSFESSSTQTINNIISKQRSIVSGLSKLYRVLRLVEPVPAGEITVKMEEPTSQTLKEKWEAQSVLINVVDRLLRMGIVSPESAARQLGFSSVYDEQRLLDFISGATEESNENDPNDIQQDDAAVRALQNGNPPGNNPSGEKGTE